jgi:TonB family protein
MRVTVFLVTVCSLALTAPSEEHAGADLKAGTGGLADALSKPLSPGSVAMLVDYGGAPETQERLVTALRDPRPETRAAAARVFNVLGVNASVPHLLEALEGEKDMDAAREELCAVAVLGGPRTDLELFAAASRSRGLIGALSDVLSRRWNSAAPAEPTPRVDQTGGLKGSATGRASLTQAALAGIRAKDEGLFEVALRVARATKTDVDTGMLGTGLEVEGPRFREATCWHIALIDPEGLPSNVKEKVTARAADGTPSSFPCEVAARILGQTVKERGDWVANLDQEGAKRVPIVPVVLMSLTPGERKALSQARTGKADELDTYLERKSSKPRSSEMPAAHAPAGEGPRGRLLDLAGFPRGFVPGVLAATGCGHTPSDAWGGAEITYGEDGRPRAMSPLVGLEGFGKCQLAARLLLRSALAPARATGPPGAKHMVLVWLDRDFVECSTSATTGQTAGEEWPLSVGGQIKEPKKTRNVNPVYPESAKKERVQGTVILEALISASGCITRLEVMHSAHPALNGAAIRAASGWRYTPALLDGQPAPVIMTITVAFRLAN